MSDLTRRPLVTLKHTVADTVEVLHTDVTGFVGQASYPPNNVKKNVVSVLITCETHGIRYAFGVNPTNDAGTAVGHVLAAGESIEIIGYKFLADLRFLNKIAGSAAVLQITPEISIK